MSKRTNGGWLGGVLVAELADVMGVPAATIRWHCRHPHGELYGRARRIGGQWRIPTADADRFAKGYQRRPGGRKTRGQSAPPPD